MFLIFHQRQNHSYWWLDAQERKGGSRGALGWCIGCVQTKKYICAWFSVLTPSCQAESHRPDCRSIPVHTHTHTHFLAEETKFIGKDGAHQDLRAGNHPLIIQFTRSYWMCRDGPKFQWNCFSSEHADRMRLKQCFAYLGKKIGSRAGWMKKWKLDSYSESPARGPVLKWFRAVAYIQVLKTASCSSICLITSYRGSLKVLDSLG